MPALTRARELGYSVGVVDRNPDAPGVSLADAFFEVSTTDIEGVAEAARQFCPDGIITIGTDMPIRSIAHAAEVLGLRALSVRAAQMATDKGEMADAFLIKGVPSPRTTTITGQIDPHSILDVSALPLIVKPSDSSGSRGVSLVDNVDALRPAFEYALQHSGSGRVLVQEYLRGDEVSVEGICVGTRLEIVAITDKLTTGAPHFVELGHSQPSRHGAEVQAGIRAVVAAATQALELADCAVHAELIVTEGIPKVVEIGARLGGDFITSHLVPLSTGVDMIEALISVAVGRSPEIAPVRRGGSAVRFLERPAVASRVSEVAELPGVVSVTSVIASTAANGSRLQSSTDRLGHVITTGESARAAIALAESAVRMLLSNVETGKPNCD